jgi:hypothetical protein
VSISVITMLLPPRVIAMSPRLAKRISSPATV